MAAHFARCRYWGIHRTFFAALKCMDGRLNLPVITQMPIGLIKPFRSLGGRFEVYWPAFIKRLRSWTTKAVNKGSYNCIFVTYHFSASDNRNLGCAGWRHDTHAAIAHARKFSDQLKRIFLDQVIPIVTGIETDRDVLILHGLKGEVRGDELIDRTEDAIRERLRACFQDTVPDVVLEDLIPFLQGNAKHIASLGDRPLDRSVLGHNERIIAVGQGFESIAARNRALIINDATLDLRSPIQTAANIIATNLRGTPSNDRALIFTSVPYEDKLEHRAALERSPGLQEFAQAVIAEACPELWASGRLDFLAGVTDERDKKLELIDAGPIMIAA
ncbi:MAG: hypothetical protein ACYC44_00890 [Patescibacteria group bacterium]